VRANPGPGGDEKVADRLFQGKLFKNVKEGHPRSVGVRTGGGGCKIPSIPSCLVGSKGVPAGHLN